MCVYVCFCDFLFPETAGGGKKKKKKKSDALGLNFQMNCRASPPTAAGLFQLLHGERARAATCLHVCNVRVCDIELLPNSVASGKRFAVIPSRRTFAERGVGVQRRNGPAPSDTPVELSAHWGDVRSLCRLPRLLLCTYIHTHAFHAYTFAPPCASASSHSHTQTHARAF